MSHVAQIKLEINDLQSLKKACSSLGWTWLEGQQTYKWYGSHVGDYPLPEGFTKEDLGKCTHAIRVPGASYEVGVVERNGKYVLLWDFWQGGGLQRIMGNNGERLVNEYVKERTMKVLARRGVSIVNEDHSENGYRIKLRLRY